MTQFWINLPVKDMNKAKDFYSELGFIVHGNEEQAQIVIGEQQIMLFRQDLFQRFSRHEVVDTKQATEVLLSLSAATKESVDDIVKKVELAGGTIFAKPEMQQEWLYGCGFTDTDGHRWNVLYMDTEKMKK